MDSREVLFVMKILLSTVKEMNHNKTTLFSKIKFYSKASSSSYFMFTGITNQSINLLEYI